MLHNPLYKHKIMYKQFLRQHDLCTSQEKKMISVIGSTWQTFYLKLRRAVIASMHI